MTDRLTEIRARWAAATPGPWEWTPDMYQLYATEDAPCDEYDADIISADRGQMLVAQPNADFIAAAPEDIDYLLGEVERLEKIGTAARNLCGALSLWRPVQPVPEPRDCTSGYPESIQKAWLELADLITEAESDV